MKDPHLNQFIPSEQRQFTRRHLVVVWGVLRTEVSRFHHQLFLTLACEDTVAAD